MSSALKRKKKGKKWKKMNNYWVLLMYHLKIRFLLRTVKPLMIWPMSVPLSWYPGPLQGPAFCTLSAGWFCPLGSPPQPLAPRLELSCCRLFSRSRPPSQCLGNCVMNLLTPLDGLNLIFIYFFMSNF